MPRRMLYSIGFFLSFIITVLFVLHFPDRATVQTAVYRFCPHGNLTPPRISPSCPPLAWDASRYFYLWTHGLWLSRSIIVPRHTSWLIRYEPDFIRNRNWLSRTAVMWHISEIAPYVRESICSRFILFLVFIYRTYVHFILTFLFFDARKEWIPCYMK